MSWFLWIAAWVVAAFAIGLPLGRAIRRNETRTRRHPAHDDALDKLRTALRKEDAS